MRVAVKPNCLCFKENVAECVLAKSQNTCIAAFDLGDEPVIRDVHLVQVGAWIVRVSVRKSDCKIIAGAVGLNVLLDYCFCTIHILTIDVLITVGYFR